MGYKLFQKQRKSPYCVLDYMDGYEDDFKLFKGISVSKEWPGDVSFPMDDDFKKLIKLSDHLDNQQSFIIASPKLRNVFEDENVKYVEYLAIKVLNHKNRIASDDYCIVNSVTTQDCMDVEKSGVTWNRIVPEDIQKADHLTLDEAKIKTDATLFRVKGIRNAVFVRDDLAEKISERECTGMEFRDIGDY